MKTETTTISNISQPATGITVTLENLGAFLGILVSLSLILTLGYKAVANINKISLSIIQIERDLKESAAQSERELKESAASAEKIRQLESRLDLHIQDYVNRKDVVQMLLGQLNEKIDHKFKRLFFYTRDVQKFLQRDTAFQVREYEETEQEK